MRYSPVDVQKGPEAIEPSQAERGLRKYSPIGPKNPAVTFMPKPEEMKDRLPTRLWISPRINVRLPHPKRIK